MQPQHQALIWLCISIDNCIPQKKFLMTAPNLPKRFVDVQKVFKATTEFT